jgi:hypothetical protein
MTATNHAVTGAFIGIAIANPLAIPLAFASHFLLDALPHFGYPGKLLHSHRIKIALLIDASMLMVVSIILLLNVRDPLLILLCMLAAILPDVISSQRYIRELRSGKRETTNIPLFGRFHSAIQWCERSWGWIPEIVWFCVISLGVVSNI